MSIIWKDDEINLLETLRPYLKTREIQQVFKDLGFNRSMDAIGKKSKKLNISFKDFGLPPLVGLTEKERGSINQVIQERENQFSAITPPEIITSSQKSQATTQRRAIISQTLETLKQIREETPRTSSISVNKVSSDKTSLVIILSDQHVGRRTVDEEGVELYNMEIGLKRIEDTPEMVSRKLTKDQKEDLDELILILAGDHADGEGIFPHHEMFIEKHAVEQTTKVTRSFWKMIKDFQFRFPNTSIRICTCRGNHGRTGLSPESNWDNIIFLQLELLIDLENNPNLTIKNRYSEYNTIEVKGWKGYIRHKAPVQADTASATAKYGGWAGIHNWDFFIFGHFHHYGLLTWLGKPIFRNGSTMNGDDYAESLAVHDNPVQLMFGVTEKEVHSYVYALRYQEND